MKLYPIPGGDWASTETDWKKAMKARGLDPKAFEATKTREVPTGKKELMEFLIFFGVDVYRIGDAVPAVKPDAVVDVAALQALHNPDPDAPAPLTPAPTAAPLDLDTSFATAPIQHQLTLAVGAIDRAAELLRA